MSDELFHAIRVFLLREPNMSIFDNFFSQEARDKRTPTHEESVYNAQRIKEEQARVDFSSIWPHVSVEGGGVMDGNVPEWWHNEWLKIQQRKETVSVEVPGTGISVIRDTDGTVIIRGATGSTLIPAGAWTSFLRVAMTIPAGTDLPETGVASPGQSSSRIHPQVKDDRPQMVANRAENERRMQFAMRNQIELQDRLGKDQQQARKQRLREEM